MTKQLIQVLIDKRPTLYYFLLNIVVRYKVSHIIEVKCIKNAVSWTLTFTLKKANSCHKKNINIQTYNIQSDL